MAAKVHHDSIHSLTSLEGEQLNSFQEISDEAIKFFKSLLGEVDSNVTGCSLEVLQGLVSSISDEDSLSLCSYITEEEVNKSMFEIGSEMAHGPDGYTALFFKASWSIGGADVTAVVLDYFESSSLLPAFNSTSLVLVLKKKNLHTIVDFKPIACCSIIYKCITNILSTRLQHFMPNLVSRNQCAFVKGRSISDNILLV